MKKVGRGGDWGALGLVADQAGGPRPAANRRKIAAARISKNAAMSGGQSIRFRFSLMDR